MIRFRATIDLAGKTATGIVVPAEVVEGLAAGKKPPVRVTLRDYTYRTTIASRGERFLIPVSGEHRAGAGVAAGDELEVGVELDTEPREVAVPDDLAAALSDAPDAQRVFDGLSYSRKQRLVLPIEGAKAAETRARRVAKAVELLLAGKA